MNWQILPATAADLESMQALDGLEPEESPSAAMLSAAAGAFDGKRALLAKDDEHLRGFVLCQQVFDEVTVLNILVTPSWRRRGLARALLSAALDESVSTGATRCLLEVRRSNRAALGLYERMGFLYDGVRKNYYPRGDSREDALMMSLELAGRRTQPQ